MVSKQTDDFHGDPPVISVVSGLKICKIHSLDPSRHLLSVVKTLDIAMSNMLRMAFQTGQAFDAANRLFVCARRKMFGVVHLSWDVASFSSFILKVLSTIILEYWPIDTLIEYGTEERDPGDQTG